MGCFMGFRAATLRMFRVARALLKPTRVELD